MSQPGGLTGRAGELDFLAGFFRQATVSGGTLLLSGDPGVEFEGDISFAGLNQALFPLLGDAAELGAAHQDALRVALGFGAGPAPGRLLVSTASRWSPPRPSPPASRPPSPGTSAPAASPT